MTSIVEHDSFTGITEAFHKDSMTGEIKVNKSADLSGSFSSNLQEKNSASSGWKETFHKVASIHPLIIEMWYNELKDLGYDNPNPLAAENKMWLIAKLNSRDFQKLRTKEGKL
jgi:hypothetical protein